MFKINYFQEIWKPRFMERAWRKGTDGTLLGAVRGYGGYGTRVRWVRYEGTVGAVRGYGGCGTEIDGYGTLNSWYWCVGAMHGQCGRILGLGYFVSTSFFSTLFSKKYIYIYIWIPKSYKDYGSWRPSYVRYGIISVEARYDGAVACCTMGQWVGAGCGVVIAGLV